MSSPFVKVYREHRPGAGDVDHEWIVDRQRPAELMDSNARRSYVGGEPWVSLRCSARRGCDARAYVLERELVDCIDFPLPKRGAAAPTAEVKPGPRPTPQGRFEAALEQSLAPSSKRTRTRTRKAST